MTMTPNNFSADYLSCVPQMYLILFVAFKISISFSRFTLGETKSVVSHGLTPWAMGP